MEFAFLTSSQMLVMLLVPGPHFEKHWSRVDLLSMFWKSPNQLRTESQVFNITAFPSRIDQSSPVLLDDPVLCAMAKKYEKTPALIALRYQLQRGVVVLAKSYSEKRIKENMQVMSEIVGIGLQNFL